MDCGSSRKRKHDESDSPVPNGTDHDITFLAKVEPPEINRLLKVLVGNYVQCSSRGAVQDIITDPAYFHCDRTLDGDTCKLMIPEHVDSYATHVVLHAALNPEIPLNCKSNVNGLTLKKLHDAAAFLKIDGHKIGLEPLRSVELDPKAVEDIQIGLYHKFNAGLLWQLSFAELLQVIRKDFLVVPCELDVYKVVKKWCDYDAASRMKKEFLGALLAEIRWELLGDILEALIINAEERHSAESVFVFYADQSQAELKQHNWDITTIHWDIPLPKEVKHWCKYKEMGPAIDGERLLFRVSSGKCLKTSSFSVVTREMRFLFEQQIEDGAHCPLACINGLIYAWDFLTKGHNNRSVKFYTKHPGSTDTLNQPDHFREEAAFEAWDGKFYYCGGRSLADVQETVSTVEVYDVAMNNWTKLPDMQKPRRNFAAKVYNGHLYVTGGAYDAGTGVLSSCERLNLASPEAGWEWIGGLNGVRYDHCMVIAKGQLFVCGGLTSAGIQRAREAGLERYNLREGYWDWEKVNINLRWPVMSCATFVMSHK